MTRAAFVPVTALAPRPAASAPAVTRCTATAPRPAASKRVAAPARPAAPTPEPVRAPVPMPGPDVSVQTVLLTGAALALGVLGDASMAHAVPDALVEAFKSKPASLAHPAVMWLMVAGTGYTFYLGYKSSTVRSTTDAAARKELVKAKFADRHFETSSALFAITTIATFSGMANTYTRTGKLFPGPHLYIGLALVAALSVMSALVPYMKKNKEWARALHFTLAFFVTGMFAWQAKSGMWIVGKLLGWN